MPLGEKSWLCFWVICSTYFLKVNFGLFVVELGVDSFGTLFELFWASGFSVWGVDSFLFALKSLLGGGGGGGGVDDFPGGFQGAFSEACFWGFFPLTGSLAFGPRLVLCPSPKPFFIRLL